MKYDQYYFQTDRIWLRQWEAQDAEDEQEDFTDSHAMAMLYDEIFLPGQERIGTGTLEYEKLDKMHDTYTILDLESRYIGQMRFNYINEHHGTFSLGIFITSQQRGKGYGTEAMGLLMRYGFNERRLHKFEGSCLDINTPSMKMFERLGCSLEGRIRESIYLNGRYHDRLLYGMIQEEYEAKKPKR